MIGIIIIIALLTVYAMIFYSLMKAAKKADEEININTKKCRQEQKLFEEFKQRSRLL